MSGRDNQYINHTSINKQRLNTSFNTNDKIQFISHKDKRTYTTTSKAHRLTTGLSEDNNREKRENHAGTPCIGQSTELRRYINT